jgi:hypothetical protein
MEQKDSILPYSQIVKEDGELRYSGVVRNLSIKQGNSADVEKAFLTTFRQGEIVEVTIKRICL